ncbi:Holliday junction resolvase RuvX [Tessaracoccus coleopterorum]|uniref:Holliday junction resolvase RuvX n=1 Tax=Tessaracoccus coleopterorum TaxID=2714950 RepID=UPI002F91A15E
MADGARLGIDWVRHGSGGRRQPRHHVRLPGRDRPGRVREQRRLVVLVEEYGVDVVYVGLPLTLAGERGIAANFVEEKAAALAGAIAPVEVRLVDERMSTVSASRSLGSAGRRARQQRSVIDQAAAVEILQRALDAEQRDGGPAGERVEKEER